MILNNLTASSVGGSFGNVFFWIFFVVLCGFCIFIIGSSVKSIIDKVRLKKKMKSDSSSVVSDSKFNIDDEKKGN